MRYPLEPSLSLHHPRFNPTASRRQNSSDLQKTRRRTDRRQRSAICHIRYHPSQPPGPVADSGLFLERGLFPLPSSLACCSTGQDYRKSLTDALVTYFAWNEIIWNGTEIRVSFSCARGFVRGIHTADFRVHIRSRRS